MMPIEPESVSDLGSPAHGDRPRSLKLRESFKSRCPQVMATFGGSDALFRLWWRDVSVLDPPDPEFVREYSTNDRFLENRLILPEEVPFLALPILKAVLRGGYRDAFFIERAAHPYLWALRHMAPAFQASVRITPLRVKGLTRESFSCNLLTVLATDPEDSQTLGEPLTGAERDALRPLLATGGWAGGGRAVDGILDASREDALRALADEGLDRRVFIPNVLKAVVFEAGNRLREGPLLRRELEASIDPALLSLAPGAAGRVGALLDGATGPGGRIDFARLLDGMNRKVGALRGTLTHSASPALNVLLTGTRSARHIFGPGRALVIEEISVCGSTCLAFEALGRAFNSTHRFHFGAIVGMWANESFLDLAAASMFTLKPLEDVPFLSPFCYAPVHCGEALRPVKPHRFPSCIALSPLTRFWKRTTFEDMRDLLGRSQAEQDGACRLGAEATSAVQARVSCDGLPQIARRQARNADVLPALVSYYLGCFARVGDETRFRHDPVLEARLETILDAGGRHQKPFYREMDCFFARLHEAEAQSPGEFSAWRAATCAARAELARRVVTEVLRDRERYEARMVCGLEAIERCRSAVDAYLRAPARREDDFKELFGRLQRAVP